MARSYGAAGSSRAPTNGSEIQRAAQSEEESFLEEASSEISEPTTHVRSVFLQACDFDDPPAPFRTGLAGLVRLDAEGELQMEERVRISANSTHALIGHGILDQLNQLDLEGRLGRGVPVMVRPSLVEGARSILYAGDRNTYGRDWEFIVDRDEGPPVIEYRVAVANREYQITLVRLVDVFNRASRYGDAVWITI